LLIGVFAAVDPDLCFYGCLTNQGCDSSGIVERTFRTVVKREQVAYITWLDRPVAALTDAKAPVTTVVTLDLRGVFGGPMLQNAGGQTHLAIQLGDSLAAVIN